MRRLRGDELWNDPDVQELERLRLSLRGLMKFLADSGTPKIPVDIPDDIIDKGPMHYA